MFMNAMTTNHEINSCKFPKWLNPKGQAMPLLYINHGIAKEQLFHVIKLFVALTQYRKKNAHFLSLMERLLVDQLHPLITGTQTENTP